VSTISNDQITQPLKEQFSYVSGCDYLEKNSFIEDTYKQSVQYLSDDIDRFGFFKGIEPKILKNAITTRRSIRAFRQSPITSEEFAFIVKDIFEFANDYTIDIFYTVHRVEGKTQGLYKNQELCKEGDFSNKSKYLSLEQNIGGESAVTFYFTSSEIEAYQKVTMLSGFLAQIIYLKGEMKGIGCTGIGAYYDEETKEFLGTQNNIVYVLAIGR